MSNESGFRKMLSSMQSGVQSGFSSVQSGVSTIMRQGNSTFYPQGLQAQRSEKSGWLTKKGGVVKSWHRRWFSIKGDYIYYFNSEDETKQPLGHIFLPGNKVVEHPASSIEPDKFLFEIMQGNGGRMTTTHESYLISAVSADERRDWIRAIRKVMHSEQGGAIFGQSLELTLTYERRKNPTRKVPEIVEQCVLYLVENAMEVEGLFRLPGRSALVRDLREKFDTGDRPEFTDEEVDIHSVASLLKFYLRELPAPLVPYLYYEDVMRICTRDMNINPDDALVKFEEILKEIPQANYNVLKYMSSFLSDVASHNDVNKMTPMNLATVFAQSFIYPEEDEPALMMGTASNRTQVVFIMLQFWEQLFKVEYSARGAAVHVVDDLLAMGGGDDELAGDVTGDYVSDHFSTVAMRESTSMDLMGLDLSGDAVPPPADEETPNEHTETSSEESPQRPKRPSRKAPKIPPRPASPPKPEGGSRPDTDSAERLYPSLPRDTDPSPSTWSDSSASLRRGDTPPITRMTSTADGDGGGYQRKASTKRDRRGWVMGPRDGDEGEEEEEVVSETIATTTSAAATSTAPTESPRPHPQIPPRPKSNATSNTANTATTNGDSEVTDSANVDKLVNTDLSQMTHDDLLNHITSLRSELTSQHAQRRDLTSKARTSENKLKTQTVEFSRKLDNEKTATAEAVDRIMVLSRQLEAYHMRYGDL